MKDELAKLLSVKSIVTLLLTGVFAYLCIANKISEQQFMVIFTVVISFYFGTQYEKNKG